MEVHEAVALACPHTEYGVALRDQVAGGAFVLHLDIRPLHRRPKRGHQTHPFPVRPQLGSKRQGKLRAA